MQQSITRNGRMLSVEFLVDLDYIQPAQRGIQLDFRVVASCLRPVSTRVSATKISVTCYNLRNEHPRGPDFVSNIFFGKFILEKGLEYNVRCLKY